MENFVQIIKPDDRLFDYAREVITDIKVELPDDTVELVGALAIPMVGRREIDVMIIARDVVASVAKIEGQGYNKGPIVNEIAYLRKHEGTIELGVQVLPSGHKMIEVHRRIISTLMNNESLRMEYEALKVRLSGVPEQEYKNAKKEWLVRNGLN